MVIGQLLQYTFVVFSPDQRGCVPRPRWGVRPRLLTRPLNLQNSLRRCVCVCGIIV